MSSITRTYTFTDGTTAYGSQVESEVSNIVTTWNNHNSGTSRWTTVDATTFKQVGTTFGPILQVVTGSSSTAFTTSNAAYQTTNLSASITPKASTSKVLVVATSDIQNPSTGTIAEAALFRGSTNISTNNIGGCLIPSASSSTIVPITLICYDSPATTSSTTYAVKLLSSNGATTVGFGNTAGQYMALIEIGF